MNCKSLIRQEFTFHILHKAAKIAALYEAVYDNYFMSASVGYASCIEESLYFIYMDTAGRISVKVFPKSCIRLSE